MIVWLRSITVVSIALCLGAAPACAAILNCGDPTTPLEASLCSNVELQRAGATLKEAYNRAMLRLDEAERRELLQSDQDWQRQVERQCKISDEQQRQVADEASVVRCLLETAKPRMEHLDKEGAVRPIQSPPAAN